MQYLCDTNIISEAMKRKPNPDVTTWLSQQDKIFISVITIEEVLYGLHHRDAAKKIEWFQEILKTQCEVMPVVEEIAAHSGRLRGRFQAQGITRSQSDLLIAATAWYHGLTVVTRNVNDFTGCGVELLNLFEQA